MNTHQVGGGRTPQVVSKIKNVSNIIMNGRQIRVQQGVIMQPGIKHVVTHIFYGKYISEFQKATRAGDIEKSAEILGKIPKVLLNSFHDLNAIASSKRFG